MARINDLSREALAQILYYAAATPANRISEWKAKLPLVAVCRRWSKLAQNLVFYRVYVELTTSPWSSIFPFAYSNTRPFWTSNAELLISRGCILAARCLTIELADRITSECLRSIALEILQLDRVDWQHINILTIASSSTAHEYYLHIAETEEASDEDIAHTMKYFAQNLRNVVGLKLGHYKSGSRGNYFCGRFSSVYGGQLQVHKASKYITFNSVDFSRNIKILELTLDSSAARILPSICGKTLKVLKLYDVPHNFAWHHFRYDTFDQPIVFQQLAILHLSFRDEIKALTESEVQDKVVSGAHCCDQLSFPALKQLSIRGCTPDCDLLYADLSFPELKMVCLSGFINSIRHCSRLKLTWVRDLKVIIVPSHPGEKTDFYRVTNHFFANICIGRTAALEIIGYWTALNPELMRWANLTILEVDKADYATACKTVGRLPNLCELTIRKLVMSSYIEDSSLFTSADPLLAWGEKLESLSIYFFEGDCPLADCVGSLQDLILHAGALKKLDVPESSRLFIDRFIGTYADRYPHLADILLLDIEVELPFE
ncbi:hypothetical protein IW146_001033 [Coemansia sp. RSA 922]|nr:hypothetical protein H4S04_000316 [Coemansia sp. S16]KAJ2068643.1 hypothetical protein GGI08_000771 [Coemansia sp. S2]KAJ2073988.1 hypothetical protein GGH13_001627 [Coemansia sp. S155-1]KAJ2117086.1 hypothetical protein IW146_001033 [Coemansia sp. RSA 922]KAJ2354254.1 hypothetical protein GGH92_000147 [Coemansia sp. RSA 2673]